MDAQRATRRWIDVWAQGWSRHDSSVIVTLYDDDALFVSMPFRGPRRGGRGAAEYAEWAFADEEEVEVWFAEPLVAEDGAAVRYWAIVRDRDGRTSTLGGISDVRFGADGNVVEQRDHWHVEPDVARAPPEDWGPFAAHERSSG
ncbi:MAG TPA: nuclear transport factor 2 family protein [Thermoanaerobaculia bacterium]|nr:nuclear transport factor 2 family protein [Thermoanaerobaculia bacterium]